MAEISFKERVKNVLINEAKNYKDTYMNYEYLIYVDNFVEKYYIITGTKENYLHLSGVHTELSPSDFFEICGREIFYGILVIYVDDEFASASYDDWVWNAFYKEGTCENK